MATICHARLKNVVHRFPERRERVATENRRFVAFIITDGRRVIVRQRPEGTPNAGFWEFPSVEPVNSETPEVLLRSLLPGMRVKKVIPLGKVSHAIMNRRLSVEAIRVWLPGTRLPRGLESKSLRALRGLPLSTITRKVMGLLNQALGEGSRG